MRVREAIRRGRWLLPILCLTLVTSASSQQFIDPESYSPDEAEIQEGDEVELPDMDGETKTYTVQEGDTLWDISNNLLGSPWYWPQVWSFNPEIANPHWIYPGNVIRYATPTADGPAQIVDPETGLVVTDVTADELVSATGDLIYRVPQAYGVIDKGFITREELDDIGRIVASFEEKTLLTRFDRVYVDMQDAVVGQRYVVFRTGREIVHPNTDEFFGYHTEILGSLQIEEARPDGVATGVIGDTLDAVSRGDRLLPWSEAFTRDVVRRENVVEMEGIIISTMIPRSLAIGQLQYVFVDRGRVDGVQVGNTFDVVRRGDPLADYMQLDEELELPWETIGEILVVETRDETSVGLVLRSLREIEPGERLLMRVNDGRQHARR